MRRAALLLVLAAGLGLALRVVLSSDDGERGRGSAPRAEPAATDAAPDAALVAPAADPARAEPGAGEAAGERTPAGFEAQPARGLALRIVAAESGAPVPDALVYVVPASDFGAHERRGRNGLAAARVGARYRGSPDGGATLPFFGERIVVAAESGDRFGWVEVLPGEPDAEVALARFPRLEVRAVDAAGDPLEGMPVAVRRRSDPPLDLLLGRTDANGRVAFDDVEAALAEGAGRYGHAVTLAIPLAEPVEHLLADDAVPGEPLVLAAPPLGRMVVRVFGADGAPLALPGARVTAIARAADAPLHPEYGSKPYGPNAASARVEDGAATFPFVAPRQRYVLFLASEVAPAATALEAFGPERAGGTRTVDFHPLDASAFVALRLVDAGGAPVAGERCEATLRLAAPDSAHTTHPRIDAAGRLEVQIDLAWEPGRTRILELLAHDRTWGARLDLSRRLEPGVHDLGDVAVGPPPLALAGRVRDERGEPVTDALLLVSERFESGGRAWWRPFRPYQVRTDGAGAFEARGWYADVAMLRVELPDALHVPIRPVEVPFGTADLAITLARREQGRIEGRLLLPPDVPLAELSVVVHTGPDARQVHRGELHADGGFALDALPEPAYAVHVRAPSVAEDLARVEGVSARRAAGDPDPRLDPLDLRGRVGVVKLEVTDAADAPLPRLRVRHRPAGGEAPWTVRTTDGARRVTLVAAGPIDVELAADGLRTVRLDAVIGERRVVLPPGLPLRFVLAGGLPSALGDADELRLQLYDLLDAGKDDPLWPRSAPFDAQGELTIAAPRAGSLTPLVLLQRRAAGGEVQVTSVRGITPGGIEIRDTPEEQRFALALDAAELERALESLAAR